MKWLGSIAVALTVASCGFASTPPHDEASYFPMSSARVWEYRLIRLENAEAWPVTVRSRSPRFIPELDRVAAIFDEEYPDQIVPVAFFLAEGFLQSEIGLNYRQSRRDPAKRGVERTPIGTQPMRIMPMPPRVGTRWAYSEQVFGGFGALGLAIHWRGSVSHEESVVVPAGRFHDCLRIESTAVHEARPGGEPHEYHYVDWYAPNVGLVKNEYASADATFTRMELVRYADEPEPEITSPLLRLARNDP